MREQWRDSIPMLLLAVFAVLLEVVGFGSSSGTLLIITILLIMAAMLGIARVSLPTAGIGAAVGAAFFLPWNGFKLGHTLQAGDLFILLALVCFSMAFLGGHLPHLPWWVVQLGIVIAFIGLIHLVIPTDPHYLATRIVVGADGAPTTEFESNITVAFKFVIGIVMLPLVFAWAAVTDRRAVRWLTIANVAGTAISGFVAFTDGKGITSFGHKLTHNVDTLSREAGFSNYPNFLAASCILALPLAIWMMVSDKRRDRYFGMFFAFCIVLGAYATGSRGGAVCTVIGGAAAFVLIPRFRPRIPQIAIGGGIVAVLLFALVPKFGAEILKATRLTASGSATAGSNAVRTIVRNQGLQDFGHSPIDGIGMQVAAEAQNVYIQEAASGGIILVAAMLIYTLVGAWIAGRLIPYSDLAAAILAAAVTGAVFNVLEADLTDRFFYVPTALLIALYNLHLRDTGQAGDVGPAQSVADGHHAVADWVLRKSSASEELR